MPYGCQIEAKSGSWMPVLRAKEGFPGMKKKIIFDVGAAGPCRCAVRLYDTRLYGG